MKAIVLLSGGLDSTLAAKLIKDLGIELVALNTLSPFCLCNHRCASGCYHSANEVAKDLDLKLIRISVTEEFLEIVRNPKHGYGSNMNPCIDCRILLFKKAKETMQKEGAAFIITGEVLGQRPMSQHKQALKLIEKESGLEGLVLRPLSAQLLPETIPEKQGWISRDKLLNFSGRTRKPQMHLADTFNIKDYPCASGGCLLTDPQFAKKVKDLIAHQEFELKNVELLKLGRHFRISKATKLVVGRDEKENEHLSRLIKEGDYLFTPLDTAGPTALGRGEFGEELIRLTGSIICRYCDRDGKATTDIVYRRILKTGTVPDLSRAQSREGDCPSLKASPLNESVLLSLRI